MMIIGLTGSSRGYRSKLAIAAQGFSPSSGRIRVIDTDISCLDMVSFLESVFSDDPKLGELILIFTHIQSQSESDCIRSVGGYIWGVKGVPSATIRLEKNDIMTTLNSGGDGRYLDPIEAISEQIIRHKKSQSDQS